MAMSAPFVCFVCSIHHLFGMVSLEYANAWDIGTRSGVVDFREGELEVHEFPFDGVNEVIYQEKGVTIRSIPAVHGQKNQDTRDPDR